MNVNVKRVLVGLSAAGSLVTGVALGQAHERYYTAQDAVSRARTLLSAIPTVNSAERKQRDAAIKSLDKADDQVVCAQLRAANPKAACN